MANIIKLIREIFCPRLDFLSSQNATLRDELRVSGLTLVDMQSALDSLTGALNKKSSALSKCNAELNSVDELELLANKWNKRHPKADIEYEGRYAPFNKRKKLSIDVRLFIQPNDFVIQNDITKYKLRVVDPLKCNDMIMKLYKHSRTKKINPYRYIYDKDALGVNEHWMFPFELRGEKRGDCEDYAHELASYLIGSGVPSFRVRCVAGFTFDKFGHNTVYVLADNMVWRHLNSTTSISNIKTNNLNMMPKSNDPKDGIGIEFVWFSYNNELAWSTWATQAQEDSFKKERKGRMKHVKISRRRV